MNDSLIYPCLVHLMKLIHNKQELKQPRKFHHARLITTHFQEGKQMFNQKSQIYINFLKYYQQAWILNQTTNDPLLDESEDRVFLKQLHREPQVDRLVCQIVVRLLILGIRGMMKAQIEKKETKEVIRLCESLHLELILQGICISDILMRFIKQMTNSIKNLIFYETLLRIFTRLDFYSIINYLQKVITEFRQEWNRAQNQLQKPTNKKDKTETLLHPSSKKNLSLDQKSKDKQKQKQKQTIEFVHKNPEKNQQNPNQACQSNFKKLKTVPKSSLSSRRRTLGRGNAYTFNNSRTSTSDFFSSFESVSFEETKIQNNQNNRGFHTETQTHFYFNFPQGQIRIDQNQAEDVLANNTPKKNKR